MSEPLVLDGLNHITRAEVVSLEEDGWIQVQAEDSTVRTCELLRVAERVAELRPGDRVLCWFPASETEGGVVLGAIGPHAPPGSGETPAELILEAKHSLTLRVGNGSITIREDGKILIKGKDLVSHAQRLNRIKGGAVQIN